MIEIHFPHTMAAITGIWVLLRMYFWFRQKQVFWKREVTLLLVYICIVVVTRFTFFPFARVDGIVQPLVLDTEKITHFHINYIPLVNLMAYPDTPEAILNFVGNTAMFVPLGIVWPIAFRQLDTHGKVIGAGALYSLLIEIFQLPFHVRVTDVDDLILNTVGFVAG